LELRLNPQRPGEVRIRIGVNPATPITRSTWGELGIRGVTGGTNVELHDDGKSSVALASTDDSPAVIPLRAGLFDRLEGRVNSIMANVESVTAQMTKVLTDANVASIQGLLKNSSDLTNTLTAAAAKLAPVADKIGPLVASLQEATRQATGMARDVGSLSRSARVAINRLDAANGPLASVTRSMDEISYAASRLNNDTLPSISSMANTVSQAARGASTTVRRLGDAPQSIFFGPAPVQAGPGEPGFAGFGGYASGGAK
jgi:phospholipid/cholesterol/gamma-HCH transport system substrate-binding protein